MLVARIVSFLLALAMLVLTLPALAQTPPTAIPTLADACDKGDAAACLRLARSIRASIDDQDAQAKIRALFERACANGSAEGCFELGRTFAWDGHRDGKRAEQLYGTACASGFLKACSFQAYGWFNGLAGPPNKSHGEAILQEACGRGDTPSCFDLANRLRRADPMPKAPERSVAILSAQCDAANGQGCLWLASLYRDGKGVEQDVSRAYRLFSRSCDLGNPDGCERLGRAIYSGDGIAPDKAAALAIFDKNCARHSEMCKSAENIRTEPSLYRSCDDGDPANCDDLATLYSYGILRNPAAAFSLYLKACNANVLGSCYRALRGIKDADPEGRVAGMPIITAFLKRSCDDAVLNACVDLARLHAEGQWVPQDEAAASALYAIACQDGQNGMTAGNCPPTEELAAYLPDMPVESTDKQYVAPDEIPLEQETSTDICRVAAEFFNDEGYRELACKSAHYVMRGFDVLPGAAPWQALIERPALASDGRRRTATGRVLCGGSLIATGWILTAAHCLFGDNQSLVSGGYRVRLGLFDVSKPEGISFPIVEAIPHERFRPGSKSRAHDIALIRYNTKAPARIGQVHKIRSINIDSVPVETRTIYDKMTAYAYGWGWTEAFNSQASKTLKGGKLALRTEEECSRLTQFKGPLANLVLCAGVLNGDQACYGDSGGPLVFYGDSDRVPKLIGVISTGKDCGVDGDASRYTRVAKYIDWIRPKMQPSASPLGQR